MTKVDIINRLKEVKPVLRQRYGLAQLALFGSYSRNEQSLESDIDLLIELSSPNADHFFACAFALQDLFKMHKVEVVSKGAIKPSYFTAIQPDLIYA